MSWCHEPRERFDCAWKARATRPGIPTLPAVLDTVTACFIRGLDPV
jgi:hypothetical protein